MSTNKHYCRQRATVRRFSGRRSQHCRLLLDTFFIVAVRAVAVGCVLAVSPDAYPRARIVKGCPYSCEGVVGVGDRDRKNDREKPSRFPVWFPFSTEKPTKTNRFSVGKNGRKNGRKKRLSVFGSQHGSSGWVSIPLKLPVPCGLA